MFATVIGYIGRKPKSKMKPIELKTLLEQTQTISRTIFDILKEHGPLTIAQTWERVKLIKITAPLPAMLQTLEERKAS